MNEIQTAKLLCNTSGDAFVFAIAFIFLNGIAMHIWSKQNIPGYSFFIGLINPINTTNEIKHYFFKGPGFLNVFIILLVAIGLSSLLGELFYLSVVAKLCP